MTTIHDVLGGQTLTGLIQGVQPGLASRLPAAFTQLTRNVDADAATYKRVTGPRQVARLAAYGSPSQQRALQGVEELPVKLLHTVEHILHPAAVLENLQRSDNPARNQLGRDELARQTAAFRQLFENLRVAAVYSMLAHGRIWFDRDGALLPDSQGAAVTVDFNVPAENQNQVDGLIDATWAAADTDIVGQIVALKARAMQTTGFPLRHAFYGANIPGYLAANAAAQAMIQGSPQLSRDMAVSGEIPSGFMDLQWTPAYEAAFVDPDGNARSFFGDDAIVLTPEPSLEWYELLQGSYAVPTGIAGGEAVDVLDDLETRYGYFSYAVMLTDPVVIKQVAGDTFLPVLKAPASIYIADVTP